MQVHKRDPRSSSPARYLTPGVVLILGALSIVMLLWTGQFGGRRPLQDAAIDASVRKFELSLITYHLWLEEYLRGDSDIDVTKVWQDLDRAIESIVTVLRGGATEPDAHAIEPLEHPEHRRLAESLKARLSQLREISAERVRRGNTDEEVASLLDRRFDEIFLQLLQESGELKRLLGLRETQYRARSRLRLALVVAGWLVAVVALAVGLWRREKRLRQAEAARRRRETELGRTRRTEAVGRLAGGVAHAINNYLGAIRGYCEIAKLQNESGEALATRMDAAMDTATEASVLIRQLLAFSRKQPIRPEVIDLNRVVAKVEQMVGPLMKEDITVSVRCHEELWPVEIDPAQVEQMLINLLVNSRDSMPRGGRIIVVTRNVDRVGETSPGRHVLLSVHDNGMGIPPEVRERIFEPFFTTKSERGSSGLGLSAVYGIVRQNGGLIAVDSLPDRGSTFEIYLPACDTQVRAGSEPPPAPRTATVLPLEQDDDTRARSHDRTQPARRSL